MGLRTNCGLLRKDGNKTAPVTRVTWREQRLNTFKKRYDGKRQGKDTGKVRKIGFSYFFLLSFGFSL